LEKINCYTDSYSLTRVAWCRVYDSAAADIHLWPAA